MASKSPLRVLGELILSSIDTIEATLAAEALSFPSINDPFNPLNKTEAILVQPHVLDAVSQLVAAASQLIATVRHPAQTIIDDALSFHLSSCMRAVLETDAVEIIREAGSEGMHVSDIARRTDRDPLKFARILRLLSNHYIFKEVSPDTFALNRLSSILDSGKSTFELMDNPKEKLTGTSGITAFVLHSTDEVMKGSAYMPEAFANPKTSHSVEPTESPLNIAFKTEKPVFSWLNEKENKDRQRRFSVALAGTTKMEPPNAILSGFKWHTLPKGSVIVDVGGGVGSSSMIIAKAERHLHFFVQDRPNTIAAAAEYWETEYPEAIHQRRVILQEHDFFEPQPICDAAAFLLRFIIHDWADPIAKQILKNLREAATPETKLIVVDVIVPYTCLASITDEIPGAAVAKVPEPLLPSLGAANNMAYWLDLQMYVFCNSQDRTLGHFTRLSAECGWRVVEVYHIPGSVFSQCVLTPM